MNRNVGAVVGVLAIGALAALGVLAAKGSEIQGALGNADPKGLLEKCDDIISLLESETRQTAA